MDILEVEKCYTKESPPVTSKVSLSRLTVVDRVPSLKVTLRLLDGETVNGVAFINRIIELLSGRCSAEVHPMDPIYYFTFTPEQLKSLLISNPQGAASLVLTIANQAYREYRSTT